MPGTVVDVLSIVKADSDHERRQHISLNSRDVTSDTDRRYNPATHQTVLRIADTGSRILAFWRTDNQEASPVAEKLGSIGEPDPIARRRCLGQRSLPARVVVEPGVAAEGGIPLS